VVDESGETIGTLTEVLRPGRANDVFVIRNPEGREVLLPAIDSVILDIDVAGGRMRVRVPEEA
jgi:16S rRNA processing protein RimM